MTKNTSVDTAQKGQATKKNNIPTGKVKTLANATERRKAREEQFRNFRIGALRRRCKRMGFDEAKTAECVAKLEEQMKAPKEYSILVMIYQKQPRKKIPDGEIFKPDIDTFCENLANNKITYNYRGSNYVSITGNQDILAKIREIAPEGAKIHPYAKKMESVIPKEEKEVIKKPSNNTAEKKATAKAANKGHMPKSVRYFHRMQKGRYKELRKISLAYKRSKKRKAITVQLNAKKSSTGSKKASTSIKKAA